MYIIINLGGDLSGGETVFCDGVKRPDLVKRDHVLKYLHGRMMLGPFKRCSREGYLWRGNIAVISFIISKQILEHLFCHGDRFYNQYINTTIRTKYIDDNGTGVKPKQFFSK